MSQTLFEAILPIGPLAVVGKVKGLIQTFLLTLCLHDSYRASKALYKIYTIYTKSINLGTRLPRIKYSHLLALRPWISQLIWTSVFLFDNNSPYFTGLR